MTRLSTAARVHRQAERQYELMLANIDEVVYMLDVQGRFTYLSPSLSRFSQYTPAELIGRPVLELVHPDDQAFVQRCLLDTLSGHEVPREFRVVDKDGT
ncbi:MAG: PAS domain S-box protein, partial [Anaerolineae bacterium]